uniref:Uncharacterized protein n=1 Tax=Ascaris lumbricoides TaxID=6252 RepID=A0A0M3HS60_ASCLU
MKLFLNLKKKKRNYFQIYFSGEMTGHYSLSITIAFILFFYAVVLCSSSNRRRFARTVAYEKGNSYYGSIDDNIESFDSLAGLGLGKRNKFTMHGISHRSSVLTDQTRDPIHRSRLLDDATRQNSIKE